MTDAHIYGLVAPFLLVGFFGALTWWARHQANQIKPSKPSRAHPAE